MESNLLYYLLRAIGSCDQKTFRRIDAPDDMVEVHVDMNFLFERHEIKFMEGFVKEFEIDDHYSDGVLNMCKQMLELL